MLSLRGAPLYRIFASKAGTAFGAGVAAPVGVYAEFIYFADLDAALDPTERQVPSGY